MIFFVGNDGTVIKSVPAPVYQGGANANTVYLIAPFAENLSASVAFQLPNGVAVAPAPMVPQGAVGGITDAQGNVYSGWSYDLPNNITALYGTVIAQFFFYSVQGKVVASSAANFTVGRGVPAVLPDEPSDDVYSQLLSLIGSLQSDLHNGYYASRAVYAWNSTYTYGANEITFYPDIGQYGAFVKSVVADNTNNAPYVDGAVNSAYWAEVVNFNTITDDFFAKIKAAQAAAEGFAQDAAQSAQDAEDTANNFQSMLNKSIVFVSQLPMQGDENVLYAVVSKSSDSLFVLYAWYGGWVALGHADIVPPATAEQVQDILDGTTPPLKAEQAENVTGEIAGKAISGIFETNGTTVKEATHAASAGNAATADSANDPNAVHYTAQQLTAEQQAQARANIGAAEGANSVTPAQLEAGLSSVFAFRNEGEALPEGMRTGASVYTYKLAVPEASFGQNVVAYNFTDPSFSPSGWIVTGGGGTAPAPAFGADGLQIAQGLFADRGTAAVANPFKGYGLESRGITVAFYGTVTGSLINDFESMFGFCDAADSADSAFDFFAVTGSGTGVRFNANGAGNLGETYFDITGGAVLDLTEPSLYVLTVTGSAITVYRNGAQQASYPYTANGANTAYRTNVLEKIAAMDYFLLGCSTGLLQWGNPAMQVQRLVLCPFALTAEEVQAMYKNSYYELKTLSGGEQAVAVERAKRLMPGEELGLYSAVYFTGDGTPAENPNICLRTGSAPFYSYSVAVGNDAEAGEGGVAVGEDANGANGVAVGALSNAGALCVAVGTSASAGSATVSGASAFGYNAAATAANTMQLGGSGNSYVYYYGTLQARSDERDKADLADFDDEKSLEFVTSLRTFSYVRNPRGLYEYTEEEHAGAKELHRKYGLAPYDKEAHAAGTKKGSRRRAGLSAQDVQAKMEQVFGGEIANLVCDSLHDLRAAGETIPEGVESQLHVGYTALVPFLVSALRAQQKRIAALEEKMTKENKA